MPDERIALYRHFCGNDLLYVGIARNPMARLNRHHRTVWFYRITRIEIEWYASRQAAMTAETAAIIKENPRFNRMIKHGADKKRERLLSKTLCEDCDHWGMVETPSYLLCENCGSTRSYEAA